MDEEMMWKGFYDKLQEIKQQPPTQHDAEYVFTNFVVIYKFIGC
jgi:hypothetical protein